MMMIVMMNDDDGDEEWWLFYDRSWTMIVVIDYNHLAKNEHK